VVNYFIIGILIQVFYFDKKRERKMKTIKRIGSAILGLLAGAAIPAGWAFAQEPDRTVLPIKDPWHPPIETLDARNATAPPMFQVNAPKGAPNVVIILLDDLGYGGMGAFGGVVDTPTFDKLASQGLRYNQFHSTALSSPTRQALKTGRNHHSCNQAKVSEMATSFPGANGELPNDIAPLSQMLRMNGYSTGAFGKWHETAVWETSPSGPFDRWPTSQGFDRFYGFIGGETNQWNPNIYDNSSPIEPPDDPNYHFMNDMTTRAIEWVRFQQSLTPDKPFFIYFAPGAVHAPHHVPEEYISKYRGKFDEGWDVIRQRIFENQRRLGVIPPDTQLAPKPDDIEDWNQLSEKERKLYSRQAEVFAGFLEMTDVETGRLIDAIEDMGELENTLIFYIAGDNGTSAEGGRSGLYNEMAFFNDDPNASNIDSMLEYYDEWGGPSTYPHMAAGWAICFDSPFMWAKQVASNYGGTRQAMVIHWPERIKARGEIRSQWHHVIDVTPTILEACGLPEPRVVNGVPQRPIEGVSMVYTWDDSKAADRHLIQYFEILGNRGVYYDGWFAGTVHRKPWASPEHGFTEDEWELYHVAKDFSMSEDLAARYPEKLRELQDLFLMEALKYKVLPLDDRLQEIFDPQIAGRPDLMFGRKTLTLYEGMGSLLENCFISIRNSSFEIIADIESKDSNPNGVIVQQGGRFGGWSLYVKEGAPVFAYNYLGVDRYTIRGDSIIAPGKSIIKLDFAYDGGKLGAGGTATLYMNGQQIGTGRIEKTEPYIFSGDETANVGRDRETPVSDDYTVKTSKFTGKINKVTITLK